MKIIFSRKGFDGTAGGCPSPIVSGRPISLPIPSSTMPSPTRYGDLPGPYGTLVSDLTGGRLTPDDWCHLDPDINRDSLPRHEGWRGALGQARAAQGHLANQGVQAGDLFIFWGLFSRWRTLAAGGSWEHRSIESGDGSRSPRLLIWGSMARTPLPGGRGCTITPIREPG